MSGTLHPAPTPRYSPADVAIIAAEERGRWIREWNAQVAAARCWMSWSGECTCRERSGERRN